MSRRRLDERPLVLPDPIEVPEHLKKELMKTLLRGLQPGGFIPPEELESRHAAFTARQVSIQAELKKRQEKDRVKLSKSNRNELLLTARSVLCAYSGPLGRTNDEVIAEGLRVIPLWDNTIKVLEAKNQELRRELGFKCGEIERLSRRQTEMETERRNLAIALRRATAPRRRH